MNYYNRTVSHTICRLRVLYFWVGQHLRMDRSGWGSPMQTTIFPYMYCDSKTNHLCQSLSCLARQILQQFFYLFDEGCNTSSLWHLLRYSTMHDDRAMVKATDFQLHLPVENTNEVVVRRELSLWFCNC